VRACKRRRPRPRLRWIRVPWRIWCVRACRPSPETSALPAGSLSRRRSGCAAGVSAAGRRPGQGARATARRDRPRPPPPRAQAPYGPALAASAGTARPRRHARHSGTASPHGRQHIRPAPVSGSHVPAGAHEAEEPHPARAAPDRAGPYGRSGAASPRQPPIHPGGNYTSPQCHRANVRYLKIIPPGDTTAAYAGSIDEQVWAEMTLPTMAITTVVPDP
jgi:hypothetical protein